MPPSLDDLQKIENAAQPTPGMGLALDHNGLIPNPNVLAPNPADGQVLTYNATTKQAQWGAGLPSGSITQYGGSAAPAGWLLCDGTSYLRTDQAALFAVIGTTFGAADGTHFNVPDLRGRVAVGFAASGGHVDVSTLGNNDGVAAANRRAKHRHTAHAHGVPTLGGSSGGSNITAERTTAPGTINTTSVDGGSGNANDSLDAPAYLVLNAIIKT